MKIILALMLATLTVAACAPHNPPPKSNYFVPPEASKDYYRNPDPTVLTEPDEQSTIRRAAPKESEYDLYIDRKTFQK